MRIPMIGGSIQGLDTRELEAQRRDLLCLAVVGDHLRWVLLGKEAAELADWLTAATAQWRDWADRVAEHLVSLGVPPDGRLRSLAENTPLNWVPEGWLSLEEARRLLADRLGTAAEWAGYRRSQTSDAGTKELFDGLYAGLETQASASEITPANPTRELDQRDATAADVLPGRTRRS
jgi:starvation-inducible DNA-binding protein